MPKKKSDASDFRYDTGEAKVPWAAVGENIRSQDVLEMVKFLYQPVQGKKQAYDKQLAKLRKDLDTLERTGQPAGKLSLANNVQAVEERVQKMLGVKHAVFLTNATAGFEIACRFAGLGPGDELIAPAITFFSTITYPLTIGA